MSYFLSRIKTTEIIMSSSRLLAIIVSITFSINACAENHAPEHHHDQRQNKHHAKIDNSHHADKSRSSISQLLPKELNDILIKEMNALSQGLSQLMPEVTSGNWQQIQNIGEKMHDSYILKQSLSKEQIKHLHKMLPSNFKTLDHQLHHSAGMMAHAAKKKNIELVNFYLYKMTETCVTCHSQYATDRFPQLKPSKKHH